MPENLSTALNSLRAVLLDPDRLVRAVAAGRRRGERPEHRRVELRWVDLRAGRRLQVVAHDERQSFTQNVEAPQAPDVVDQVLAQPFGSWHVQAVDETVQLRVTKKGEAQVHRHAAEIQPPDLSHDRLKARMLDPDDAFLRLVGISDQRGQIKPTRQAKYRQVEEFLRAFDPVLDRALAATGGDALRIADLGCGNAYLTFAARSWLDKRAGLAVSVTGVDVKETSAARNNALADELGWADSMSFVAAPIDDVHLEQPPHVVFALHACDTATDDALARAVRWEAPAILAAPCCHNDLQRQLGAAPSWPSPYGMLARHGILRERFADVLTDAFRAAILRILGYRVDVIEFVGAAHTPRNTLLRAVCTGADPDSNVVAEYRRLCEDWKVQPALGARLADLLVGIRDSSF